MRALPMLVFLSPFEICQRCRARVQNNGHRIILYCYIIWQKVFAHDDNRDAAAACVSASGFDEYYHRIRDRISLLLLLVITIIIGTPRIMIENQILLESFMVFLFFFLLSIHICTDLTGKITILIYYYYTYKYTIIII